MGLDKDLYNFARRGVFPLMQNGVGSGALSMGENGKLIRTGVGREFFVAGNWGADTNDGLSWDTPFLTLAAAITANNADVAADKYGWATRNRIYFTADPSTESLTSFPAKCDVIGVGSCDAYPMPTLKGRHTAAAEHLGCRWFNIRFRPEASGDIFTLSAYDNGMAFIGCQFVGVESTITTSNAIVTAACELLTIMDCDFDGAFGNEVIYIGTGNASGLKIIGNRIRGGASDGIYIKTDATFTSVNGAGIIKDNFIYVALITINDVSSKCYIVDNRGISAADDGTAGAGNIVGNVKYGVNNILSGNDKTFLWPALAAMA